MRGRDRAWEYYQHADNLVHNRYGLFMVAQSVFAAAFTATDERALRLSVAGAGVVYALVWWWISVRLAARMKALDRYLLADPAYARYIRVFDRTRHGGLYAWPKRLAFRSITAHGLMNWALPLLTALAWALGAAWIYNAPDVPELNL